MATVEKRGNSYRITVSNGYDLKGNQIKRRMTWTPDGGMTERQIQKELERQKVLFEEKVKTGQVMQGSTRFAEFTDFWLKEYGEKQLRPSTISRYRDMLVRINQGIGNIRLDHLLPNHLIQFYNELSQDGSRLDYNYKSRIDMVELLNSKKLTRQALSELSGLSVRTVSLAVRGESIAATSAQKISDTLKVPLNKIFSKVDDKQCLSNQTILHYHRLISSILEKAVKWQVIFSNPCHRVEAPKPEKKEALYWDEVQASKALTYLKSEPLKYQAMITLLLYSGMRRGELCGLEWSNIDFEKGIVNINKTSQYLKDKGIFDDKTKTYSSVRVTKIPPEAIDIIRMYRREQIELRLKLGDRWVESNKVFTQWDGRPIYPGSITQWFRKFIKRYDLPPITLHGLRHTNATLLIAGGTDIRTVAARLGHSNTSTTTNIYAHAIQSADERASELLGNLLEPVSKKA